LFIYIPHSLFFIGWIKDLGMKRNILIIEDNEVIREGIAELLTLEGFSVITADCGPEAIMLAQGQLPDLIICDIVMPDMDGFEVLIALKQDMFTYLIPFLFSTANSENKDRQKAKALGIENYLVKPFDGHELMNCVEKCLLG
jgi:CheY-like chemotaxis protein